MWNLEKQQNQLKAAQEALAIKQFQDDIDRAQEEQEEVDRNCSYYMDWLFKFCYACLFSTIAECGYICCFTCYLIAYGSIGTIIAFLTPCFDTVRDDLNKQNGFVTEHLSRYVITP